MVQISVKQRSTLENKSPRYLNSLTWSNKISDTRGRNGQLLLCVERSQFRWFRHLLRMPSGHLPRQLFQAHPAGRRPPGRGIPWDPPVRAG